ncbi:uncharacterized protein LOC128327461 [Hemicordylus capensis]|uniref:uncharacterized protein LOC128327461 n=1 Tax=Hemicordylus capensis TaxID=884348 RepID=UPI002302B00E|nr:uncharacterized protein LOC128327461 [Hemicordylus capensis]
MSEAAECGVWLLQNDPEVGALDPLAAEGTAAQALQELRHRRQLETAATLSRRHLLVDSNPEASRRLLQLHAQTELVQQEATFQAALLVIELTTLGDRSWDPKSTVPEACHQELAQLRLAEGPGTEPAWRETKSVVPGRSMVQVLLDRLLLQQERNRACLVQILLTLAPPDTIRERGLGRKQPVPLGAGCGGEDTSPALQEAVAQMLTLAQERLEGARRAEVSWQDGATAVLVTLQHAQLEELSGAIEDLAGIMSGREGDACPALYEKLLARLQETPRMSLLRQLQPTPPGEQRAAETLQVNLEACSAQEELLLCEPEALTAKKMLPREEILGPPQKLSKMEVQGPPGDQNIPQDQTLQARQSPQGLQHQQLDPNTFQAQTELLRKSKSLGSLEFVTIEPEGLRNSEMAKAQQGQDLREVLQHQECPERERKLVQVPESLEKKTDERQDLQDPEAPQRNQQAISPQEQKTETCQAAMDRGPLEAQEKLQGDLQRCPSPETPPLLWRVLGQKAKSFELTLHHQDQEVPQTEKVLQMEKPIPTDPQAAHQHSGERTSQVPQEVLGDQSSVLTQGEIQALQPQEMTGHESPAIQGTLQRRPQTLQSQEIPPRETRLPSPSEAIVQREREEPQVPLSLKRKGMEPLQVRETTLEKGIQVPEPQDQGRPESPPLLWGALGVKSKTFELRKPSAFKTQLLRESLIVQSLGRSQIEPEAHKPQGYRDPKGLSPQELREAEVQAEKDILQVPEMRFTESQRARFPGERRPELLQPQDEAQRTPQITTERSKKQKVLQRVLEVPKDPEAVVQELRDVQALQSYSEECLKILQARGSSHMVLHSQECRSPETPPLLWRILELKAKSFELRKPCTFRTQKLSYLEPTFLAQRMPQKELQAPQIQEVRRLEMVQPQSQPDMEPECCASQECGSPKILEALQLPEKKNLEAFPATERECPQHEERRSPESCPLLWRVLGLKAKSFELRKPRTFQTQKLMSQELPEVKRLQTVQPQGKPYKEPESCASQGHEGSKILDKQEPRDPKASQIQREEKTSHDQEIMPKDSQGERAPESPPLLWRVLELKANSFELRKPRTFRTQKLRYLEPTFLAQRMSQGLLEVKRLQTVQPQGKPYQDPESCASQEHGGSKMLDPQEPRDPKAFQIRREKKPSHDQEMMPEDSQGERAPESPPLLWRVLELKAKSFELRKPRAFRTQKLRYLEPTFLAQRMSQTKLHEGKIAEALQSPPALEIETELLLQPGERRSPETPPLLWWALELAQQSMPHHERLDSPQSQEKDKPPAIQPQGTQQVESKEDITQKTLSLQDAKEPKTPQVLKETSQDQGMISSNALLQERRNPESLPPQGTLLQVESLHPGLSGSQGSQNLWRAEPTQRCPQVHEVQLLKEMESVLTQGAPQIQEGDPGMQETPVPKEVKDCLLSSGPQDKVSDMPRRYPKEIQKIVVPQTKGSCRLFASRKCHRQIPKH